MAKNHNDPSRSFTAQLWTPSETRRKNSNLTRFIALLEQLGSEKLSEYPALHEWSVNNQEPFWQAVWDFGEIHGAKNGAQALRAGDHFSSSLWFKGATLNFAENLLRRRDHHPALIFRSEEQPRRVLSYLELYEAVASAAAHFRSLGIVAGDRVAGYIPNMPEAVIAMLAAASIGAIWSSCSPDFGVAGVLDRFGQIEPKLLVVADGYFFKGIPINYLDKVKEVAAAIPSLKQVLVAPLIDAKDSFSAIPQAISFKSIKKQTSIKFESLPFEHPLYIMYSSGTTGKPKCIVHSAGGTLIEHLKELILHTDLKPSDVIIYQTTCGWMMWNWLVSSLATGATVVLYDGFPLHREGRTVFDILDQEKISIFGTNAKFLALIEKEGLVPKKSHGLNALHTITSTGSVLLPESFDYVYQSIKSDVCLSSISGGTDIIGCFSIGCPLLPVYRGEAQCKSLGLDVQVYSAEGLRVIGEKGELVCVKPFPSMPIYFWNDPQGEKYQNAYFKKFPGVWHHGDYVEETSHGGHIYFGRSDATLKPGGVRIGTAEIYQQVERLSEITEAVVVGQDWEGDTRIILFVRLAAGIKLSEEFIERVKKIIRENTSPFHVPRKIVAVTDLPRTRSNKIAELAVREAIHGRPILNTEALANPECLEQFKNRPELAE